MRVRDLISKYTVSVHLILIIFIPFLIYYKFLWNPIVFDDLYFFDGSIHPQYLNKFFDFSTRWLPYATFEWTRVFLGADVVWLHLGNLFIHLSNGVFLYIFLSYIFSFFVDENVAFLSSRTTAFFATILFLIHPAAVYSVNYISQRSMLMATFFAIAMLYSFVKGVKNNNHLITGLSVVFYGLSVLCKEHAIMLPAVSFLFSFLFYRNIKIIIKKHLVYFLSCFVVSLYILFKLKSMHLYGNPYEIGAGDLLSRLHDVNPSFNINSAYYYSIFTQFGLFFKYILLWIVPSSLFMSVDMYEMFSTSFFVFSKLLGAICFFIYPVFSLWLVRKNGLSSLFGVALLCPWVLFFTEISTVRIQESFVIYRSYIWMIFLTCSLPFLIQKIQPKKAILLLSLALLCMLPLTLQRLVTFSHPLLLWDDAARLVVGKENRPGVERIYHNRGLAYLQQKQYKLAIVDFNKAIEIWPKYSFVYNDRGAAYLALQDYQAAMNDFDQSIKINPSYFRPYLGRAYIFELMGRHDQAKDNYVVACSLGMAAACTKR